MIHKKGDSHHKGGYHQVAGVYLAFVLLVVLVAVYANGSQNGHVVVDLTCGNSLIDAGEQCDGTNLNAKSCASFGFPVGTLTCTSDCNLDTRRCTTCGNGEVNKGEQCDGANLGGKTCQSLNRGFSAGTLSCTPSCLYNTARCSR